MTTATRSSSGSTLSIAFSPTQQLVQQIQQKWQQISSNTSDDDSNEFEMLLASCLSRLQAYNECVSGQNMVGSNK